MAEAKKVCRMLCMLFCALVLSTTISSALAQENAALSRLLTDEDARHLLARTGIGVSASEVVKLRDQTRQQAIDRILAEFETEPAVKMPDWVHSAVPHFHARQDMDDDERARFNSERDTELSQLRQWWMLNMLETDSPQTERMVLFWHDLFATSYYDLNRQSQAVARQNITFRQLGMGSWEALLRAMIRDPALLEFLDAGSNHKDAPNENLGRELLELFVLGEGNYTESDIRNAARSLTGHDTSRIHNLAFRLKTWTQDRGEKTLFGVTGNHDGNALITLALNQPAAARFLVSRFWLAFVSDTAANERWVSRLAKRFRDSNYDIAQLYRDVLESDAFWHQQHRGSIIKSPVDLIAGTARSLEYPKTHWAKMALWQAELGMDLFAPPNVAGWKEGAAFVTPGLLLNRYRMIDSLLATPVAATSGSQSITMQGELESAVGSEEMSQGMSQGMSQSAVPGLHIKMAAEDYQGPAHYEVALYENQNLIWKSDVLVLNGGHDTELYGRISNQSELPWQFIPIAVSEAVVNQSTRIEVRYLNDAAGPGGDRNLYIDGIQIGELWLPGNRARQQSECVPRVSSNAWKLHCAGTLTFDHSAVKDRSGDELPAWRASAAHINWVNENPRNKMLTTHITLDHLATPGSLFHALQFSLKLPADNKPALLSLNSYHCWPDCFEVWPPCAWTDPHFPAAKTISFAWLPKKIADLNAGTGKACPINSIRVAERELIATLWRSIPDLIEHLKSSNRGQRFLTGLEKVSARIKSNSIPMSQTAYTNQGGLIVLGSEYIPPQAARHMLPAPVPKVGNAQSLQEQLMSKQLNLKKLLVPDIKVSGLNDLSLDYNTSAAAQLDIIVNHPLFQVK
ncbi:MAG: DUF1800 family protein [Granulosicoccus sp.]